MLKAIAAEHDLCKTTLQHIKSVLSAIFTHAKNEGAFDGVNPVPQNRKRARRNVCIQPYPDSSHSGFSAAVTQGSDRYGVLRRTPGR